MTVERLLSISGTAALQRFGLQLEHRDRLRIAYVNNWIRRRAEAIVQFLLELSALLLGGIGRIENHALFLIVGQPGENDSWEVSRAIITAILVGNVSLRLIDPQHIRARRVAQIGRIAVLFAAGDERRN